MLKVLQRFLTVPLFLSIHGSVESLSAHRSPNMVGDVLLEDFAIKVSIQSKYENLALDNHMDIEIRERFKYHVSIEHNTLHQCSGTVVIDGSLQAVITAASCVSGKDDLIIRYRTPTREKNGKTTIVRKTVVHHQFNPESHAYDIAILFANNLIEINSPLTLPRHDETFVNLNAYVTGWPTMYQEQFSNLLLYAELEVLPNEECQPMDERYMLCAGVKKDNVSYCHYNMGSPVAYQRTLIGFSMWDKGCHRHLQPTNFMRVSAVSDWIEHIIRTESPK